MEKINWVRVEEILEELTSLTFEDYNVPEGTFTDADYDLMKAVITDKEYEAYNVTGELEEYDGLNEYRNSVVHSFLRVCVIINILDFKYGYEQTKDILNVLSENYQ